MKFWGKLIGYDIQGKKVDEDGCFDVTRVTPPDEPEVIKIDSDDEDM